MSDSKLKNLRRNLKTQSPEHIRKIVLAQSHKAISSKFINPPEYAEYVLAVYGSSEMLNKLRRSIKVDTTEERKDRHNYRGTSRMVVLMENHGEVDNNHEKSVFFCLEPYGGRYEYALQEDRYKCAAVFYCCHDTRERDGFMEIVGWSNELHPVSLDLVGDLGNEAYHLYHNTKFVSAPTPEIKLLKRAFD